MTNNIQNTHIELIEKKFSVKSLLLSLALMGAGVFLFIWKQYAFFNADFLWHRDSGIRNIFNDCQIEQRGLCQDEFSYSQTSALFQYY